jgi:hypothetical protein
MQMPDHCACLLQASQDDLNDPGLDEGGPGLDDFEVVHEEDQGGQPVGSDIDGELDGEQLAPEEEEGEDLMDENYLRYGRHTVRKGRSEPS